MLGADILGAELSGILRDNLGHGLSNLTVKASYYDSVSGSNQVATTTDATGHFSLSAEDGLWSIEVAPAELNARGYLSVSGQYSVTDTTSIRLATRKLDFAHRPKQFRTLKTVVNITENAGAYELEFDIVWEGVLWMKNRGNPTAFVQLTAIADAETVDPKPAIEGTA